MLREERIATELRAFRVRGVLEPWLLIALSLYLFFVVTPTYGRVAVGFAAATILALGVGAVSRMRGDVNAALHSLMPFIKFFGIFIGWAGVVSVFQTDHRNLTWSAVALFLAPLGGFLLSYLVAYQLAGFYSGGMTALFCALSGHVAIVAADMLTAAVNGHVIDLSIAIGRFNASIVCEAFILLLIAACVGGEMSGAVRAWSLYGGALAAAVVSGFLKTRNMFVSLLANLLMSVPAIVAFAARSALTRRIFLAAGVVIAGMFVVSLATIDKFRSERFGASFEKGIHRGPAEPWLNDNVYAFEAMCRRLTPDYPAVPCPIDQSVYYRVAWFLTGIDFVLSHPAGAGISMTPFGDALTTAFPQEVIDRQGRSHSHSGLVDIGISFGLPGVGAVMFAVMWLFRYARNEFTDDQVVRLGIILLSMGLLSRAVVDSVLHGAVLAFYLSMIGVMAGTLDYRRNAREKDRLARKALQFPRQAQQLPGPPVGAAVHSDMR